MSPAGVRAHGAHELPALLSRTDGLVWVDIPVWDEAAQQVLGTTFGFHPLAIRDSANRNSVPKIHCYDDHVFLVLHAPQPGEGGHVHYVELDQFIGERYLVTVHGPLNPAVNPAAAMVEVETVLGRLNNGKLHPDKAFELSYALLTALTGRLRSYTAELTKGVWKLEQRVTGGHLGDPESFLEEMFRARHGLLAVSTMSALSREVYGRMATLAVFGQGRGHALLEDAVDQPVQPAGQPQPQPAHRVTRVKVPKCSDAPIARAASAAVSTSAITGMRVAAQMWPVTVTFSVRVHSSTSGMPR